MPRAKRERVFRYYLRVLASALDYLGVPDGCREFIEAIAIQLGFDDRAEFIQVFDGELADCICASVSLKEAAMQRLRRQRRALRDWQALLDADGRRRPALVEFNITFDFEAKQQSYGYKFPLGVLIAQIIEQAPIGTKEKKLAAAVIQQTRTFVILQSAKMKPLPPKRRRKAEAILRQALTLVIDGYEIERKEHNETSAENLLRRVIGETLSNLGENHTPLNSMLLSLRELLEGGCYQNDHTPPAEIDNRREEKNVIKIRELPSLSEPDPDPSSVVPIGQTMEEFLSDQESQPLPPRPSKPDTWFSLSELEAFDPRAGSRTKKERRFCCPSCGTDKPLDADHRSLSVNTETGVYICHRCQSAGKLREYCDNSEMRSAPARQFPAPTPAAAPKSEEWRTWFEKAAKLPTSPGAAYLAGRGVPTTSAHRAGVRFSGWYLDGSVMFPIRDQAFDLVAFNARAITGDNKKTRGEKSLGVFFATPEATEAKTVAITEAPIDALILAACGLNAIALCGKSWPAWLPEELAGRDVLLMTDADGAGDECAAKLAAELTGRAVTLRIRPDGVKDWAELAEKEGLDAVRLQVGDIFADCETD